MTKHNTGQRFGSNGLGRLVKTGLLASALGAVASGVHAGPQAVAKDLGPVDATTPLRVTVWLKGSSEAALDAGIADLYDPASPSYHRWMTSDEVARFGPTTEEVAMATSSFEALGLHVDKVRANGAVIEVSAPAGLMQSAFGTTIHRWQGTNSQSGFFKATNTLAFKGAHAELVGAVSGLNGHGVRPFASRQLDLATGLPAALVNPAAGTDPLASFTTQCFGKTTTVKMHNFGIIPGGGGMVDATFTGPTYADMTMTVGRKICGYTPAQVLQHYGFDQAYAAGLRGKGQTIVIVDAYGSPTLLADTNEFSRTMGLPALDASNLQVVQSNGPPDGTDPDWAIETALDVEWAHAIAPDAKIVLVVAPSNDNAELAYGVDYASANRLGSVISNSWGLPESESDASDAEMFNGVFKRAAARGISVNVATGDAGDNGTGTPVGAPNVPSDSPYATAIGGTSIGVPSDVGPVESAWGLDVTSLGSKLIPAAAPQTHGFLKGGGGGESVYLAKPRWQRDLPGVGRQVPDISALADPQTGAIFVATGPSGQQSYGVIGGTSLATPIFSAIWALVNEASGEWLGQAAPTIAKLPSHAIRDIVPIQGKMNTVTGTINFHDATTHYTAAQMLNVAAPRTSGFASTLVYVGVNQSLGYDDIGFGLDSSLAATVGWDNATGYGVPDGMLFIDAARQFAKHRD